MAEPRHGSPGQSSKVLIITAAITSLTTIAVSFVGIVPQIRSQDRNEVAELKRELDDLKQKTSQIGSPSDAPGKKMAINGSVTSADGLTSLGGYDVYLLPEGNNLLTAKTDDGGKFTLRAVPEGVYSIIVRDSTNGKSGKGLLDDVDDEVRVIGARIKYHIQK
jgi:hypothetical protein